MKNPIFKLYQWFMGWRIRFAGRPSKLRKAIRKADTLHATTGRRYRVFFFGYKFRVWTRQDIKQRKAIGLLKRYLKAGEEFDKIAFYDTDKKGA